MKNTSKYSWGKRILAFALAVLMVAGYIPTTADAATTPGTVETVADPVKLGRADGIYGENTINAGRVTVDKAVTDTTLTLPEGELPAGENSFTPGTNNFLVTVSQAAQVMGLVAAGSDPVDVVFVLDVSGSMTNNNREQNMVTAANNAIRTLMDTNPNNRVGVVAFSAGSNNNDAATVLSALDHYTGTAATSHLTRRTSGQNSTITGRGTGAGSRQVTGGTNIQAGIALGAKMLLDVAQADTYITNEAGEKVTRMPFIIVLSDGSPTFSMYSDTWYNSGDLNLTRQDGSGDTPYAGNGFLPALTAAYYKGAVTEHYFGTAASQDQRCYIYTLGVQLDSLSGNEEALAQITMDPATYFKAGSGNNWYSTFNTYWNSYTEGQQFAITVNGRETNYSNNRYSRTIPVSTITATKNYVNGLNKAGTKMYNGGLTYNDGYYNATNASDIASIFDKVLTEIQKKAITAPTHVGSAGADFSGYVTFTDPLGEYMEVKDLLGIVADGRVYRGATAARHLEAFGKTGDENNNPEFDDLLRTVLKTRLSLSQSQSTDAFVDSLVTAAANSANQAYWNSNTDYDHSIVWWGNSYPTGEEDENVQVLSFADNDTIEYIEAQRAANAIPADADYVCRSYFFYGTAGDTVENPDHEYLYFMVRVQRELTAPYKQTVVISAPARLLSQEEVLITEELDANGNTVYTAEVTATNPARVIYEVGLRSDITPVTVGNIVSESYKSETPVDGLGSVNYDDTTDTYYFFTNDWDRTQTQTSHNRSMAKATFDAALDNAYYAYQEDTPIVNANGEVYQQSNRPTGGWYVAREYYDWSEATYNSTDEVYTGVEKKTIYIPVELDSASPVEQAADGTWYIPKGVFAATTLESRADEVRKDNNATDTAITVSHHRRTGVATNSHYTVTLGNNGRLSMVAEPAKTVYINDSAINNNGDTVTVGDELTYEIKVVNTEETAASAVVEDEVPKGTSFVSADNGGALGTDGKTVTWNIPSIPAGGSVTVSMTVKVLPSAIAGPDRVDSVSNTAYITLGNNPTYATNTTTNPPEGKKVTDLAGNEYAENAALTVGTTLVYRVRAHNDTDEKSEVVITDIIPEGTAYIKGTADHNGQYDETTKTITWTFKDNTATGGTDDRLDPGTSVVVSFQVVVEAGAKLNPETEVQPEDGTLDIQNHATIKIGDHDPEVTNNTTTKVSLGDISLTKIVASGSTAEEFTLFLTESGETLSGTYVMYVDDAKSTVTFTAGKASVQIRNGQVLTVKGLPEGTRIAVAEDTNAGWTPTYSAATVTVSATTGNPESPDVTVTNNYTARPAHFQLKGTKTFAGTNFPVGNFTFDAVEVNEDGTAVTGTPISVSATVEKDAAGEQTMQIEFSERTFSTEFVRYYKITEQTSAIAGVVTDSAAYLLKLQVVDNGEGQLMAYAWLKASTDSTAWENVPALDWANDTTTLSFANNYPDATAATISGTKVLANRYIQDKEFSFELLEDGRVVDTVVLSANGTSATGNFSFTRNYTAADMVDASGNPVMEKTFSYTLREITGTNASISYSAATFNVDVTVKNVDAKLVATVDYDTAADGVQPNSNVRFENTFTPDGASLNLSGTKTLYNGATADPTDVITPVPAFSFGVYEGQTQVVGATNDENGNFTFAPIDYTLDSVKDGTDNGTTVTKVFTYTVKENVPAVDALTYDHSTDYSDKVYTVEVTVTYTKATGAMTAEVTSVDGVASNSTSFAFENTKYPETVTVTPVAWKITTGTELPEGLRFSFSVVNAVTGREAATGISAPTGSVDTAVEFTNMVYDYSNWLANRDSATSDTATLYYWIQESNAAQGWVDAEHPGNGIQYDQTRYLMKVVLTYSDGQLTKDVTYYKDTTGTAAHLDVAATTPVDVVEVGFNNVYHAAGFINLTAEKNVSGGRNWEANEFDFRLQRLEENGKVIAGSEIVGINGAFADGTASVTFATMNYTEADLAKGEIRYVMTEINLGMAAIPGVKYDTGAYIVTIALEQDAVDTGKIIASVQSVHRATVADGVYTAVGDALTVSQADATTNTWALSAAFNNSYTPAETTATIEANKNLTGRDLAAGEFSFELYRVQWNAETGKYDEFRASTVTNQDADGDGEADDIVFNRTYNAANLSSVIDQTTVTYVIKEITGNRGGVSYTGDQFYVQVEITHDKENAKYEVTDVRYYGANVNPLADPSAVEISGSDVVFENTYSTNDTYYIPTATKVLLGANGTEMTVTDGQFSFGVVEVDVNGNVLNGGAEVAAGVNKADGSVEFGRLTYSHNATLQDEHAHYYKIVEDQGSQNGITYDSTGYYLKVTIHDDGNGILSVEKAEYFASAADFADETKRLALHTDGNGDGTFAANELVGHQILFTNHYGPGQVSVQLSDMEKVVKVTTDEGVVFELEGAEFDFDLYKAAGEGWDLGEWVTSGSNSASDANGVASIHFGTLNYTRADVYGSAAQVTTAPASRDFTYIAKERALSEGSNNGITVDGKQIKITVTVTDDGYGNMTAAVTGIEDNDSVTGNESRFTNIYEAAQATITLTGRKTLLKKALTAGEFTFVLEDKTAGTTTDLFNDVNGNIVSQEFVYTAPGTYTYVISEKTGSSDNYTYDQSVYTVVVTVTDDLEGNLHANAVYYKDYDETAGAVNTPAGRMEFLNTYIPSGIEVDLNTAIGATKTVVDPNGNVMQDKVEGFDFEVVDISGNVVATGTSDEDGNVAFTKFKFDTAGEYHYRVREAANADKPGYDLDARAWRVYILVRYYDGKTVAPVVNGTAVKPGSLYIVPEEVQTFLVTENTQAGLPNGEAEQVPAFVNAYKPDPLNLTLTAGKDLSGRNLYDNEFTFRLVEGDILRGEAKNKADGTVSFTLTYNMPGTYTYQIREVVPADENKLEGVTYDEVVRTVSVTVRDENGELVIDNNATTLNTGITFENTFTPRPVIVGVGAHKELTGKALEAGEFTFELVDENDKVVALSENTAEGNVLLLVQIDAIGDYVYTVREKEGADGHVRYDPATYQVTVSATQDAAGQLVTAVTYHTEDGEMPVFTNDYKADASFATVYATKKLAGKQLDSSEFTFELVDKNGQVVKTGTNNVDGSVALTVDVPEKGEYIYTLREKAGTDGHVTYDPATYKVTVKAVQNDEGKLDVTVTYGTADGKMPVFENSYKADASVATVTATKELTGKTLAAGEFTFELVDEDGNVVKSADNNADGTVSLTVEVPAAGEYVYTLREKKGTDSHVTYDPATYKVTVKAVQNNEGKLDVTVDYGTADGKSPLFKNYYKAGAGTATVTATKELNGKPLAAGEFTFELVDADGKVVATGTNDASGKVVILADIPEAGEYVYTLREKKGTDSHVTYDTATYKVTVKAVQNGEGKLDITVTYANADNTAPVFKNTYKPDATAITLTGTKKLTGRDMVEGEFKFQIHDSTGTLVSSGTNNAKGEIVFDAVKLPVAGNYELTVSEVDSAAEGMTYDTAKFTVKVTVTNNNGVLVATAEYPESGIVFANTFEEPKDPDVPDTGDHAQLGMWIALLVGSVLCVGAAFAVIVVPNKKGKYQK